MKLNPEVQICININGIEAFNGEKNVENYLRSMKRVIARIESEDDKSITPSRYQKSVAEAQRMTRALSEINTYIEDNLETLEKFRTGEYDLSVDSAQTIVNSLQFVRHLKDIIIGKV